MGIGKPGVERKYRHLYGETHEHQQPDHAGQGADVGLASQCNHIEAFHWAVEVEQQDADQHESASAHRVQDELHRGVLAALAAPDPDQQVHGGQLQLPEQEEQKQIPAGENACHRGLDDQQEGKISASSLLGLPGNQHSQENKQRIEHEQWQAQAIHT